jgi:hypothetical protein
MKIALLSILALAMDLVTAAAVPNGTTRLTVLIQANSSVEARNTVYLTQCDDMHSATLFHVQMPTRYPADTRRMP